MTEQQQMHAATVMPWQLSEVNTELVLPFLLKLIRDMLLYCIVNYVKK
jgi:hypothetical protein